MSDVVERVKKLLALAAGDGEEARTAAHLACRTIAKHGLTIVDPTSSPFVARPQAASATAARRGRPSDFGGPFGNHPMDWANVEEMLRNIGRRSPPPQQHPPPPPVQPSRDDEDRFIQCPSLWCGLPCMKRIHHAGIHETKGGQTFTTMQADEKVDRSRETKSEEFSCCGSFQHGRSCTLEPGHMGPHQSLQDFADAFRSTMNATPSNYCRAVHRHNGQEYPCVLFDDGHETHVHGFMRWK